MEDSIDMYLGFSSNEHQCSISISTSYQIQQSIETEVVDTPLTYIHLLIARITLQTCPNVDRAFYVTYGDGNEILIHIYEELTFYRRIRKIHDFHF